MQILHIFNLAVESFDIVVIIVSWTAWHIASDSNKFFIEYQDIIPIIAFTDIAVKAMWRHIFIRSIMNPTFMFNSLYVGNSPIANKFIFVGSWFIIVISTRNNDERQN